MNTDRSDLPSDDQLSEAVAGLRGWRSAGENHADRGGDLTHLDDAVETALSEAEWRLDAEAASEDEIERPSDAEFSNAIAAMHGFKDDGPLARDIAILLRWLDGTDAEGRPKKRKSASPFDVEDLEAIEHSIASLRSLGGEDIDLVIGELDRLRGKFEEINDGKTVLIMSDADRATRVQDLDDASLAAWARWVFLNMERVRERRAKAGGTAASDADTMTVGAMQGVIGLALLAYGAGNTHISFETEKVTFGAAELGDWEVTVRQIRKADGSPA